MSEAEVIEKTGAEEGEQVKETAKEAPKPSRADWEARQIERASKSGWKDFDAYIEEGGDPDKWKTADAFNVYGELIGTVKRQKAEFDQQVTGLVTMTQAQLATQRAELKVRREEFIEEGGKSKEVKALDRQIEALSQPVLPQSNTVLDDWNAENQWINEDSPKAVYAKDVFGREIRAGKSVEAAIATVESGLKKHYPPAAHKPATVPENERGSGAKGFGKQSKTAVTMESLTSEERAIWKHSGSMWKNDPKEFLKSVQTLREADKGGK